MSGSISNSTFKFLRTLRKNNNRDWMQANREWYLDSKANFTNCVEYLIHGINKFDKFGYIEPKSCLYRLNRDLRFSPDKTPYNYHFSAMMGTDGRKTQGAAYYFRIKPGGLSVFAAGSSCMPNAKQLENMRSAIVKYGNSFAKMLNSKAFKNTFVELKSEDYKRVPKPYAQDHPLADYLKLKYYWAEHYITDKQVLDEQLLKNGLKIFKTAHPLVRFINNHINVKN